MKLLFDQNLAPRLVDTLADLFPGSRHVRELDLSRALDETIWTYAKEHGFSIVSKDSDFQQLSFVYGAPPKVIWIRRGNCSVSETEQILRDNVDVIREFEEREDVSFLMLS